MPRPARRELPLPGALLLAGVALVLLTLPFATNGHVVAPDAWLFHRINDLPAWLDLPLEATMALGTLAVLPAIAVVVLGVTRRWQTTLAVLLAGLAAWLCADLGKELVARGRPADLLAHVHLRASAQGFGYPSGHTAVAFATMTAIALAARPRWRWVAWGVAAVVGLARVYVGAHFPLDVLGGAGLGLAIGTLAHLSVPVPEARPRARA